jgi:hypothetical protein
MIESKCLIGFGEREKSSLVFPQSTALNEFLHQKVSRKVQIALSITLSRMSSVLKRHEIHLFCPLNNLMQIKRETGGLNQKLQA